METQKFLPYLNIIEGVKTILKEQHWLSNNLNEHKLIDDILSSLINFQDNFAEEGFVLLGKFKTNSLYSPKLPSENFKIILNKLIKLIQLIREDVLKYPGLLAICDNFIHDLNKYKYLSEMQ